MQGKKYLFIHTGMADPFVTTANNHLIKAFQPTQASAAVQFDKGRIHHFAHGRLPADPHISDDGIEDVHATIRDDRYLHDAVIYVYDADAFLAAAVQEAHFDRERLVDF